MAELVKCGSCGERTPFDPDKLYPAIKAGTVHDLGRIGNSQGGSDRLLSWTCPDCRKAESKLAYPVELQCARIVNDRQRREAAGKDRATAIDAAVTAQMDDDERRRFPGFYHWRRVRDAEALGAWQPPKAEPWAVPDTFGRPQ